MTRTSLEQRRRQAATDLADVERQLAEGELDAETAARLAATYRSEILAAEAGLDAIAASDEPAATKSRRSPARVATGAATLVAGFAIAIFAVTQAVEPRGEGEFVTGGGRDAPAPLDLADVTNEEMEAVIADNPDVVPMRLALARRYVEDGAFSDALRHYMVVLDDGPHPEALAYVGWMTYLSGDTATGEAFLERSLVLEPDYALALWFLANLKMDGRGDPAAALPLVDALLATDLPNELRGAVTALRARASDALARP